MDQLISKNEIWCELSNTINNADFNKTSGKAVISELFDFIDGMQIFEIEPTVHAHWIHTYDQYGNRVMMCSKCEASFKECDMSSAQSSLKPDTFYCPTCGAKMDENGAKANETN